jgi:hypothetical protein
MNQDDLLVSLSDIYITLMRMSDEVKDSAGAYPLLTCLAIRSVADQVDELVTRVKQGAL